jgi:hypothetical protein
LILTCLIAISITPTSIYHDLFADHTDTVIIHEHLHDTEVTRAGIDCDNLGFVADKNYLFSMDLLDIVCPAPTVVFHNNPYQQFFSQHHFYAELRGPPTFI